MWWLAILGGICLVAVLIGTTFREAVDTWLPETTPFLSTLNKKPSGYSGFYEVCEKAGLRVNRWQDSYRYLRERGVKGTLLIVGPTEAPTPPEASALIDWVQSGNDLVYLDDFTFQSARALPDLLGLVTFETAKDKNKLMPLVESLPEAESLGPLKVSSDSRIDGGKLLCGEPGRALMVEVHSGAGRCLIGSTPGICSNERLADADSRFNFQFMYNWLSESRMPIYFDEKCHGLTTASNALFFILRSPVGYVLLQVLIIMLVALVSLNQRFGRPVPVSTARRISNLEFIDGLATTYERARARDTAWAMIYAPFKARLCKSLAVAPHESTETIAAAWAQATGASVEECRDFLQKAQAALERKRLDQSELVNLVATCDRLSAGQGQLSGPAKIMGA
jgi:hypothetical protein